MCIEEDTTKGERTRRRLLDVAASEVARRGLAGASLSAIAREVGIKPGSIYFHFGSKEALIEAMLEDGIRASLHRLAAALDDTPAPGGAEGRLRAAVRAHLGALADLRDYAVVVLAPQFAEDREALPTFRALRHDYLEQAPDRRRRAARDGASRWSRPSRDPGPPPGRPQRRGAVRPVPGSHGDGPRRPTRLPLLNTTPPGRNPDDRRPRRHVGGGARP